MNSSHVKIGVMGGVHAALGGAGLEVQMRESVAALRDLGQEVIELPSASPDTQFDLVHAFGAHPANWYMIRNWTRARVPLVVSPVITVPSNGLKRAALGRLSRYRPGMSTSFTMARDVALAAASVIALTEVERELLLEMGVDRARVEVIGNGSDAASFISPGLTPTAVVSPPRLVMVGAISPRKMQLEVVAAVRGHALLTIVGGSDPSSDYGRRFADAALADHVRWLGHVADRQALLHEQRSADALVLLSREEGESLAVLDSLAMGTPVILSDIPPHRDLARRYPDGVHLVSGIRELADRVGRRDLPVLHQALAVPTWHDIAARLIQVYASVLGRRAT